MTIRPPAHIEPIVTGLGEEAAIRFFLEFGGAELYIARDPKGQGMVERKMGVDVARALSAIAERHLLPRRVPIPKPWIARVWKNQGLSTAEIARRLHASDKAVRGWVSGVSAEQADDPRQPRLF